MNQEKIQFLDSPIPVINQNWDKEIQPYLHVWLQTYNHEKFIKNSIEGVLAQVTKFPIKILIHDDASTDNTANIIKQYEVKYPELIKAYYQKTNTNNNQNNSLRNEYNSWRTAKYEAPCEGDDYWIDPYKLQKQVDFLENNNFDLVYSDLDILYQTSGKIIKNVFKNNYLKDYKNADTFIINCGYKAPCTWVYKKSVYDEIPLEERDGVDQSFIIMAYAMLNKKVGYVDCSTAVYRILDNSLTHSKNLFKIYNRELDLIKIQKKYQKYFDQNFILKLQRAAFVRLFFMELALKPNTFDKFLEYNFLIIKNFKPKTKRELVIKILIPIYKFSYVIIRLYFRLNKYSF